MLIIGTVLLAALSVVCSPAPKNEPEEGLKLEQVGTERVYFTHNGKPLLSFGGLSDFIFYAAEDAYNYKLWADWAAEHGINHVRAYPPLSWRYIEKFATDNGGSLENVLFPYEETSPGSRQFDLTKFNHAYWERFRRQCELLQSRGIIIHLLMWNGWQLRASDTPGRDKDELGINWSGHFFNPANNINSFTDHLGGDIKNRFAIYHSVADQNDELADAQKAWFQKLVEMTADLDNVYYDLVHELAEHQGDWEKTQKWIDGMAAAVRERYQQFQPDKQMVFGMDTGGLSDDQRDWIFTRPYFDVLIYGKKHTVEHARDWRMVYKKPYIPQECWDDDGVKYSYMHPEQRVHTRKYMWKFMLAKCQQMDLYTKQRPSIRENLPQYPHNYDARGRNQFEDDALVLRKFWNNIVDYPNLWFNGKIESGPGARRYILCSSHEAILYLSSATGEENVEFDPQQAQLTNLPLIPDENYIVDIIDPKADGDLMESRKMSIIGREAEIALPAFVDELALHIHSPNVNMPESPPAIRAITSGPKFHWFGYYDKLEFDPIGRYVLGMEVDFEHRSPTSEDVIKIGMVDLQQNDRWIELGASRAWGWQQGCMLQWRPGSNSEIVWNDRQGERFVCHILDVFTREKRTLPNAIYTINPDGKTALTADFRRIQDMRHGYGYAGLTDPYADELAPEKSGIWRVDLESGNSELIISLADVNRIPYDKSLCGELIGAKHWFNHLLFNPDGTRFIFLHRWRIKGSTADKGYWGVRTRMFTASADGSDIRLLDPYGKTSHFIWRDSKYILAWAWHPSYKSKFYLYEDGTDNVQVIAPEVMTLNGHCSYLPGNEWILNDTNLRSLQPLYLYHIKTGKRVPLGDFALLPEYKGEWRCDLHPRFSADGTKVVIDSPHAGNGRQLYLIDISDIVGD